MPTRIRTLDERICHPCIDTCTEPVKTVKYYAYNWEGQKKMTVDVVGHKIDYRYFMIPTYKTRVSKYKGKDPRKASSRTYLTHVNLRRPKTARKLSDIFVKLNNFSVQSFRGFCTRDTLKTPSLPQGWTTHSIYGPLASHCYGLFGEEILMGFNQMDLSRQLPMDSSYVNSVLQRAWGKVSNPDVDFVEIVGELQQLMHLLASPIKAFSTLARKFDRWFKADAWVFQPHKGLRSLTTRRKVGRAKVSKQVFSEAANRWLEYRYGLIPAVLDCEEILKKFGQIISYKPELRFKKAKNVVTSEKIEVIKTIPLFDMFTCKVKFTMKIRDTYTCKVYYKYKYTNAGESFDLGLNNASLPQSMWELTFWSFVVDWFFSVGDWIRSLNEDPCVTILGNYVSRKRDVWCQYEFLDISFYGMPCKLPNSKYYTHSACLERTVNHPMPALPVFNPDFLKWRRVLDSLSLLWGTVPYLKR